MTVQSIAIFLGAARACIYWATGRFNTKNVLGTLKTSQTAGARPRRLRERHAISSALHAVRAGAVKPSRIAPARLWLNVLQRQRRRKSTLCFGNPASTLRAIQSWQNPANQKPLLPLKQLPETRTAAPQKRRKILLPTRQSTSKFKLESWRPACRLMPTSRLSTALKTAPIHSAGPPCNPNRGCPAAVR